MNEMVRYEVDDDVAWLTIRRPEARNALSAAVRSGLFAGLERFEHDERAQVLVLTGTGDEAFCAGGDLKEMAEMGLGVPPPGYVPQLGRNVSVSKPTIAAVNGVAYAGGFMLAQSCDLCIAAEHARFAITEAKVGRGAPWAAPLAGLVGTRIALQLLLTGDPIDARRAHEVGLVNEVVPASQLRAAAQQLARTIAVNAPLSVRAGRAMVYSVAALPPARAFAEADRLWEPVYLSEDACEGPRAFRAGRSPRWKGR